MYVYLSVCPSLSVSISVLVYVCLNECLHVSFSLFTYMCVCFYLYLNISLSFLPYALVTYGQRFYSMVHTSFHHLTLARKKRYQSLVPISKCRKNSGHQSIGLSYFPNTRKNTTPTITYQQVTMYPGLVINTTSPVAGNHHCSSGWYRWYLARPTSIFPSAPLDRRCLSGGAVGGGRITRS